MLIALLSLLTACLHPYHGLGAHFFSTSSHPYSVQHSNAGVFFVLLYFTHGAGRLQGDLKWLASAH